MPDGPNDSETGGGVPARPRCVLWLAPGASAPEDLRQSLEKRGLGVVEVHDPFAAMARLCVMDRSTQPGEPAVILIVASPAAPAQAAEVVHAAERYAPRVVCWLYDAAGNPKLRRILPEDVQGWSRQAVVGPAGAGSPPRLRLTDAEPATPPSPTSSSSASATAPSARPGASGSTPITAVIAPARPGTASRPRLAEPDPMQANNGTPPGGTPPPGTPTPGPAPSPPAEHRPRVHPILTNEELSMLLAEDLPGSGQPSPSAAPFFRSRPGRGGGGAPPTRAARPNMDDDDDAGV